MQVTADRFEVAGEALLESEGNVFSRWDLFLLKTMSWLEREDALPEKAVGLGLCACTLFFLAAQIVRFML